MQKNLMALSFFMIVAVSFAAPAEWLSSDTKYRQKISIQEGFYVIDEKLKDFPVMLEMKDADNHLFANAKEDGADIVFTASDGKTIIPHEIEVFSKKDKSLVVWVRIPELKVEGYTNLYMYYGNPKAVAAGDSSRTWANGYAGVWHLNNSPKDSTSNHIDGKLIGDCKFVDSGISGGAFNVLGQGVIDFGKAEPLNFNPETPFTLELKVKIKNSPKGFIVLRKGLWTVYFHLLKRWYFRIMDDPKGKGKSLTVFSVDPAIDVWRYIVGVYDAKEKTVAIYVDGLRKRKSKPETLGDFASNSNFSIGQPWKVKEKGLDFMVDEVKISNVARSSDWIAASHKNQCFPGKKIKFKQYETYK
jgi:hypothetical protein